MKKVVVYIILLLLFVPLFSPFLFLSHINNTIPTSSKIPYKLEEKLKQSDVAGTDLYAEKISAFATASSSLIKQSLFTNDTNIFSHFDANDPAFYKCNLLFSVSNSINPEAFPQVLRNEKYENKFDFSLNSLSGILYYDKEIPPEEAELNANRALGIIKKKFEIDLIMLDVPEQNYFPFVGYYPNWEIYFREITTNLPMDGYWKALNITRLTREDYLENYHLTSTFMLINNLAFLDKGINVSTEQMYYNIDTLELDFSDNFNLGAIGNLTLLTGAETDNATLGDSALDDFSQDIGGITLENNSRYTVLTIQYEGMKEGIKSLGSNQIQFDLWDALGYSGEPLSPSEKVYIALTGAFLSEIDINILCTDVIDSTPQYFEFSDYLIEQLGLLSSFAESDFDIQSFENYSFEVFWTNEDGVKHNNVKILNKDDPEDLINLLPLIGFRGFPLIPTGLLNPVENFIVTFNISNSEPNLLITKEIIGDNASFGVYREFSFRIMAENVGNLTAWGIPTSIPINLVDTFSIIPGFADFLDAAWEVIQIEYPDEYNSLDDFLNVDEDPMLFNFDTNGDGTVDDYFPDLNNFTNLSPYNEDMDYIIDLVFLKYPELEQSIGFTSDFLKDYYTNEYSIYNDDNWYLKPGEKISIIISNLSISDIDSYYNFYSFNFMVEESPQLPEVISGTSYGSTSPSMALYNDSHSWIIKSEEFLDYEEIEVNFIFESQNKSIINELQRDIDNVSLEIDFNEPHNLEDLDDFTVEIFNFSTEEFQDINSFLTYESNFTQIYSFIKSNNSIDWIFNEENQNNYTILLKLRASNSTSFHISIDNLDIQFSERNINTEESFGSQVLYGSSSSSTQYNIISNSITLSTHNMASIKATSYLSTYNSKVGEINTYYINFKNIGSNLAKNINISIGIPGIIHDPHDFILYNNNLSFYLSSLAPSVERTIKFSFYAPNSATVNKAYIKYRNPDKLNGKESYDLTATSNELYFTAPIDYNNTIPYIRTVEVEYTSSKLSPKTNSTFTLTLNVNNTGPNNVEIFDLKLKMNDQFGDLIRIGSNSLTINNINYNQLKSVSIVLNKSDWKGYYYPSVNNLEGSESRTIQISKSQSILLGNISFSIVKYVDKNQVMLGDAVTVFIEVKNTGSVSIKDVNIDDAISYTQVEFSLVNGMLVNTISELKPGEITTINYTIKAKTQNEINLEGAVIEYYFLSKFVEISNTVEIKIINPQYLQLLFILIPSAIALVIVFSYILRINKYKIFKLELLRNEMSVLNLTSRDSILKVEYTFRDRLKIISENSNHVDKGKTVKEGNGGGSSS